MTRALLTKPFKNMLENSGFYVVPDAGGLTATVYKIEAVKLNWICAGDKAINVGKLSYSNQSVDYDLLMQIVRSAA